MNEFSPLLRERLTNQKKKITFKMHHIRFFSEFLLLTFVSYLFRTQAFKVDSPNRRIPAGHQFTSVVSRRSRVTDRERNNSCSDGDSRSLDSTVAKGSWWWCWWNRRPTNCFLTILSFVIILLLTSITFSLQSLYIAILNNCCLISLLIILRVKMDRNLCVDC